MKLFLGIDQSFTSTGFAVIDDVGNIVEVGTLKTEKDSGDTFYRAARVASLLIEKADSHLPMHIGAEGLAFSMVGNATRDLAGLLFVIVTQFRETKHPEMLIVPPNSVKKFATGKGNAKKDEMVEALPIDVAIMFKQGFKKTKGLYDVTDAYWIARYILNEYNRTIDKNIDDVSKTLKQTT